MTILIVPIPLATVLALMTVAAPTEVDDPPKVDRGYSIPLIDLADQEDRRVVVDREPGQYLGHPTTVLLEDGQIRKDMAEGRS